MVYLQYSNRDEITNKPPLQIPGLSPPIPPPGLSPPLQNSSPPPINSPQLIASSQPPTPSTVRIKRI